MAMTKREGILTTAIPVVISGMLGIFAQIVLLRELLVNFQGNELSLGIILANWLIFEALGAFIAGKVSKKTEKAGAMFAWLQILVALSLTFGILTARASRLIMGLSVGEGLGIDAMFLVSSLALSPVAVLHGASFTFGSVSYANKTDILGRPYVHENIGTMLGGILVTFLLLPRLNSLDISFLALILAAFVMTIIYKDFIKRFFKLKVMDKVLVAMMILIPILVAPIYSRLDAFSLSFQWQEQNLVSHKNTLYGTISVVERLGEYTFFSDGQPLITTPFPNIIRLEEFVHFAMLSHPKPVSVLVLTGGAGGKIYEILRHPSVQKIDYVELDPMLPQTIKQFSTDLTQFELTNPIVNLHLYDGRHFLNLTQNKYDVSFVGIENPADIQSNRFFTFEFFRDIEDKLNPQGVLAISLPSLPRTQLNVEGLRSLTKTVYKTLREVFTYVRVYPGESTNIFIASNRENILYVDASTMETEIEKRQLDLVLLNKPYIEYRTLDWWRVNFYASIENWELVETNRDFIPHAVFDNMRFFSSMFTPGVSLVLDLAKRYGVIVLSLIFFVITLFLALFRKKTEVPFAIFSTGFAGMVLDLALIFAFQAIFGFVFFWMGLLVSVFMAGAALSALFVTRLMKKIKNPLKIFSYLDLAVFMLCLVLPILLMILHVYTFEGIYPEFSKLIFLVLSLKCGILVGAQYPLACYVIQSKGKTLSKTVGLLYGLDLLGGWAGGILGSLFFIPLFGIGTTLFILAGIKLCSSGFLWFSR